MEEAVSRKGMPHNLEAERSVIGSMLLDKEAAFLLPDALREKLLDRLAGTEAFPVSEVWEKRQSKGDDPEEEPLRGRLALIWQALREKKKLRFVNIDPYDLCIRCKVFSLSPNLTDIKSCSETNDKI